MSPSPPASLLVAAFFLGFGGLLVLAGTLHPASLAALDREPDEQPT